MNDNGKAMYFVGVQREVGFTARICDSVESEEGLTDALGFL